MSKLLECKPFKTTPPVKGRMANQVIKRSNDKPSAESLKRNANALKLVRKLRG